MSERSATTILELLALNAPTEHFEFLLRDSANRVRNEPTRAVRLGLAVQRRLARQQQREASLSALLDSLHETRQQNDLQSLCRLITRRACLLLGADMSAIFLRDEVSHVLRRYEATGCTSSSGVTVPLTAGLVGAVLASNGPAWTPEYLSDESFHHDARVDEAVRAEGLQAMVAVPVRRDGRIRGVLYVADREVRSFTADEITLVNTLGTFVGSAFDRIFPRSVPEESQFPEPPALRARGGVAAIREHLVELALSGVDIQAYARELSDLLECSVEIVSADCDVLARSPESTGNSVPEIEAVEALPKGEGPVPLRSDVWATPLYARGEFLGTLVTRFWQPCSEAYERLLSAVARPTSILFLEQRSRPDLDQERLHDEFLEELLLGAGDPAGGSAGRIGIDFNLPHVLVVARPGPDHRAKLATWASAYVRRVRGLKCIHDGDLVLLVPGSDASATARAVCGQLSSVLGHPVTVGAAEPATPPASVRAQYLDACRCVEAMVSLGVIGRAAAAGELGFLGPLLSDSDGVRRFVDSTVGPVVEYDRKRRTDLTGTLEKYLTTGNSLTLAAKELHVHPNTVSRRMARVGELLGEDWHRPERAFEVQLALRVFRLSESLRRQRPRGAEAVQFTGLPAWRSADQAPRRRARPTRE